jgi:hypothetical protein
MKWLNQLAQVIVLVLCVGGLLAYVMETDGQSSPVMQADGRATEPFDRHVESRDPNHLFMPTVELAMQRQRELDSQRTHDNGGASAESWSRPAGSAPTKRSGSKNSLKSRKLPRPAMNPVTV